MKQYITIEQLKELTEEELIILNSLHFNPYLQRIAHPEFHTHTKQDWIEATCKINIGIMIEILINNIPSSNCMEDSLDIECDRTTKSFLVEYRTGKCSFKDHEGKELCDVLWSSVKNVIKGEI